MAAEKSAWIKACTIDKVGTLSIKKSYTQTSIFFFWPYATHNKYYSEIQKLIKQ